MYTHEQKGREHLFLELTAIPTPPRQNIATLEPFLGLATFKVAPIPDSTTKLILNKKSNQGNDHGWFY